MKHKYLLEIRDRVFSCLRYGADNAIVGADLAAAMGVEKRTAQKYIQLLRRDLSAPIISNNNGYYLTDDPKEIREYVNRHMKAGRTRFYTMKEIKSQLRIDPNQLSLSNYEDAEIIREEPEVNPVVPVNEV